MIGVVGVPHSRTERVKRAQKYDMGGVLGEISGLPYVLHKQTVLRCSRVVSNKVLVWHPMCRLRRHRSPSQLIIGCDRATAVAVVSDIPAGSSLESNDKPSTSDGRRSCPSLQAPKSLAVWTQPGTPKTKATSRRHHLSSFEPPKSSSQEAVPPQNGICLCSVVKRRPFFRMEEQDVGIRFDAHASMY